MDELNNNQNSVVTENEVTDVQENLQEDSIVEEKPNFVKYRLMLEVFNELDIFRVEYIPLVSETVGDRWQLPEDICVITRGSAEKVNLDDSTLLAKLREQITF